MKPPSDKTIESERLAQQRELEAWREAIKHDLEYLRELYKRRFPYDSAVDWHNPSTLDLQLPEAVYKATEPVEVNIESEGFLSEDEEEPEGEDE